MTIRASLAVSEHQFPVIAFDSVRRHGNCLTARVRAEKSGIQSGRMQESRPRVGSEGEMFGGPVS